jgi:hypothetical protein
MTNAENPSASGAAAATSASAAGGRSPAGPDEDVSSTIDVRLPERRRRLRRVVIGTLSACTLILIAAGIARVARGSPADRPLAAAAANAPATTTSPPAEPAAPTTLAIATAPNDNPAAAPTNGSIRLDRGLAARSVSLDGKPLRSATTTVACGRHDIKIGRGQTHPIDVPCGGELRVSR